MPPKKKTKVETAPGKSKAKAKAEAVEATTPSDDGDEEETKANPKKRGRAQPKSKDEPLKNQASTEFQSQDFSCTATTSEGKLWNLKISTWNVDGIRAWIKKGGLEYIQHEDPDILCLQETKCSKAKLPKEVNVDGYHSYWCDSQTEGYAGIGLYTKTEPIHVRYGLGDAEFDNEGRLLVAEFDAFHLVNVYVPNSGRKLVTLPKRMEWDVKFRDFLAALDAAKPVVVCGDMNVAHHEIDIANPKGNKKNAGFTVEERQGFTTLLDGGGFVDAFRRRRPDAAGAYTFWTYMANARSKNIGWRLDYCLLSQRLAPHLCECLIRSRVFGSDHCPVVLFLHVDQ